MVKDFIVKSRKYFSLLLLFFILFGLLKYSGMDMILRVDGAVINFVQNHVVRDGLTQFFKVVTNMGDVLFFTFIIFCLVLFLKDKKFFSSVTFNLLVVYLVSVVYKNVFRRERPLYNLIDKPTDFSFPSGHTMCSVAFYGFLIYLIFKYVEDKFIKYVLISLCLCVIFLVCFSRIYLNVHFFTDVIGGAILGLVCLLMFINYVRIKDIV